MATKASDKIRVSGVAGFEGEYELDQDAITMGDLKIIKRVAGVRAGEIDEAVNAGDVDVIVALAMIAMKRSGLAHWAGFEQAVESVPIGELKLDYVGSDDGDDATDPQSGNGGSA